MELVYMDGKKEPYTTSAIIAECAGIKHHAIQEHIRKQIARLEQFGKVSFKMRPLQSGQQAKDYILNEQQAITFIGPIRRPKGRSSKVTLVRITRTKR